MIRPLRIAHGRAAGALAVGLPLAVAAALAVRPVEPIECAVRELARAAELGSPTEPSDEPRIARTFVRGAGPWGRLPLEASFGLDPDGRTVVEFVPRGPLLAGELLTYWSPSAGAGASGPGPAARLLGRLGEAPRRFLLPRAAAGTGHLILFDLARSEQVASRPVPTLVEAGRPAAGDG